MIDLFGRRRPYKVLSVRQPWAWLIVSGHKNIENRTWKTDYRGPLLIHAGINAHAIPIVEIERSFKIEIARSQLAFGAIVGCVDLVDIVTRSDSPWFDGPFGWVLSNPRPIAAIQMRGQMGLFDAPDHITQRLSTLQ